MFISRTLIRGALLGFIAASSLALTGCGYNDFQKLDEAVKADWSHGGEPA